MKVKILPGKQIQEQSSTFIGYITKAETHAQVRNAYMRMKLALPQARHILCGYRITGTESYYSEDFCDDGEYSGGRAILETMKKRKIRNCAIFVVQFYGGTKLGTKRYELIKQATEYMLEKSTEIGAKVDVEETQTKTSKSQNPAEQEERSDKTKYRFTTQKQEMTLAPNLTVMSLRQEIYKKKMHGAQKTLHGNLFKQLFHLKIDD